MFQAEKPCGLIFLRNERSRCLLALTMGAATRSLRIGHGSPPTAVFRFPLACMGLAAGKSPEFSFASTSDGKTICHSRHYVVLHTVGLYSFLLLWSIPLISCSCLSLLNFTGSCACSTASFNKFTCKLQMTSTGRFLEMSMRDQWNLSSGVTFELYNTFLAMSSSRELGASIVKDHG